MRNLFCVGIAAGLIVLNAGRPSAQQIDARGTWSGEITVLLESNDKIVEAPRRMTVVIDQVDGSLVRGFRQWEAITDDPGNIAGEDVLSGSEPFIGAIDTDGVTIRASSKWTM